MDNDLRRLVREDLLESILESFLDKGWDSCVGIVGMSEVETMSEIMVSREFCMLVRACFMVLRAFSCLERRQ